MIMAIINNEAASIESSGIIEKKKKKAKNNKQHIGEKRNGMKAASWRKWKAKSKIIIKILILLINAID